MKNLISLTLSILCTISAGAQYKFGTLDIRTSKSLLNFSNAWYTPLNGKFIMEGGGPFHPYMTDFTTAGTNILINPGGNYKLYLTFLSGRYPTIKNGGTELALFFYDRTGVSASNYIPYATDGTLAGTVKLKEFKLRGLGRAISMQNKFYFSIEDSTTGDELWMSDGTPAGTKLLIDLYPGATSSQPSILSAETNRFFFIATTPAYGGELWCSNGTAAGTYMVKDITPGPAGTSIGLTENSIAHGGIVFFWAKDPLYGYELWRTDGSAAGTYMLKDIKPGSSGSYGVSNFATANNLIFFAADDSVHGTELWATDGSAAGTRMVKDISLATSTTYKHSKPRNLIAYKGEVYFSADDSIHGRELWKTSGEANGTVMVKDICTQGSSDPSSFYIFKNHLFFAASFTCEGNPSVLPKDLHYTDGTTAGTKMIRPSTATIKGGMVDAHYIEYKDKLFFQAYYHGGYDMWYIGDSILMAGIENIETSDIALYPNPAHHNFTIKTTTAFKAGSITLTDVTSRVVKTEKLYNNEQAISLQGIAPGIYMADVWLDDKRSTQKIVVE